MLWRVVLVAAAVVAAACPAAAYTLHYEGERMAPLQSSQRRDNVPAVGLYSGATIEAQLIVTQPANDFVQLVVATSLMKPEALRCTDLGQGFGYALSGNQTTFCADFSGFKLRSHATEHNTTRNPWEHHLNVHLIPHAHLEGTRTIGVDALFVVVLNSCAFVNVDGKRGLSGDEWQTSRVYGKIVFRNPFGYLRGEDAPLPVVYVVLAAFFLAGFAYYMAQGVCCRDQRVVMAYHWAIILVSLASVCAYCDLWVYYALINFQNTYATWLFTLGNVALTVRDVVASIVFFMLSTGWGMTHTELRLSKWLLALAGTAYAFFSVCTFAVETYATDDEAPVVVHVFQALQYVFDACFAIGALFNLKVTHADLMVKNQQRKAEMIRKIGYVFAGYIALQAAWYMFAAYGPLNDRENWKYQWLQSAGPEIVFAVGALGVMWLWRPNKRSKYLQYASELQQEEDLEAVNEPHEMAEVDPEVRVFAPDTVQLNAMAAEHREEGRGARY